MDEILKEAYVNLASNYIPGDDIYVFGYSRGGAIAIAFADIISTVGLLRPDCLYQLHNVWDLYLHSRGSKYLTQKEREEIRDVHLRGKRRIGDERPRISYLGLFDPVAGNSWDTAYWFTKLRFEDIKLPEIVDSALGILAIDDDRNPSFSPVVMSGSSENKLEQVWMPGVHGNIGGNSESAFLGNVALLTMIEDIQSHITHLEWDTEAVGLLRRDILEEKEIVIDDERSNFFKRHFLCRESRKIGSSGNEKTSEIFEKRHCLFDYLQGREFHIRGKLGSYHPNNIRKDMLSLYGAPSCGLFKAVVEKVSNL